MLPASPDYEHLETKGKENLELASFINILHKTRTWVSIFRSLHTNGITLSKLLDQEQIRFDNKEIFTSDL